MMNNRELAETFTLIGDLLEIRGEIIYKTLAYRKAAENLSGLGREASEYWKEGKLEDIPGVGKAIAEKIDELLRTGKLEFLEKLKAEVPEDLASWLKVPGLGPKKVGLIWAELGITTLPELELAAKEGKLRGLPGMGEKSEAAILEGLASLGRRSGRIPLGRAFPLAHEIAEALKKAEAVRAAGLTAVQLNLRLRNTAVTELTYTPRAHQLLAYNVVAHLDDRPDWITYA